MSYCAICGEPICWAREEECREHAEGAWENHRAEPRPHDRPHVRRRGAPVSQTPKFDARRVCKRCGRRWHASWLSQFAYAKLCNGCNLVAPLCTCEPLSPGEDPGKDDPKGWLE